MSCITISIKSLTIVSIPPCIRLLKRTRTVSNKCIIILRDILSRLSGSEVEQSPGHLWNERQRNPRWPLEHWRDEGSSDSQRLKTWKLTVGTRANRCPKARDSVIKGWRFCAGKVKNRSAFKGSGEDWSPSRVRTFPPHFSSSLFSPSRQQAYRLVLPALGECLLHSLLFCIPVIHRCRQDFTNLLGSSCSN